MLKPFPSDPGALAHQSSTVQSTPMLPGCKFLAECLNAHWFMSLENARAKCKAWRRDYDEVRPHGAIGNKTRLRC
jgi:transposase InsO family protein